MESLLVSALQSLSTPYGPLRQQTCFLSIDYRIIQITDYRSNPRAWPDVAPNIFQLLWGRRDISQKKIVSKKPDQYIFMA